MQKLFPSVLIGALALCLSSTASTADIHRQWREKYEPTNGWAATCYDDSRGACEAAFIYNYHREDQDPGPNDYIVGFRAKDDVYTFGVAPYDGQCTGGTIRIGENTFNLEFDTPECTIAGVSGFVAPPRIPTKRNLPVSLLKDAHKIDITLNMKDRDPLEISISMAGFNAALEKSEQYETPSRR